MAKTRVVNRRTSKFDVNIARPSVWGNPYTHLKGRPATKNRPELVQVESREAAVAWYREYMLIERHDLLVRLPELRGKRLGCWCHPEHCHGNVLIELLQMLDDGDICRQCGCSQNSACPEGCGWAQDGLCTVCDEDPDHGPEPFIG